MKPILITSLILLVGYNVTSVLADEFKSPDYTINQETVVLQDNSADNQNGSTLKPSLMRQFEDKGYAIVNADQENYSRPLKLNSENTALISLSPMLSDIIIKPGTSASLKYLVENEKDPVIISLEMVRLDPARSPLDFTINKNLAGPVTSTWGEPFLLDIKEKHTVNITLSVNGQSQPGSYYYGLAVKVVDLSFKNKRRFVKFVPKIISPILLTVSNDGSIESTVTIVDLRLENDISWPILGKKISLIDSFDSPVLAVIAKNSGIHHSRFKGELLLSDFFGVKTFPTNSSIVFPNSTRPVASVTLPRFLLGEIQVKLKNVRTTFFAFPFKLTAILIAGAISYLLIIRNRRQK